MIPPQLREAAVFTLTTAFRTRKLRALLAAIGVVLAEQADKFGDPFGIDGGDGFDEPASLARGPRQRANRWT